MSSSAPSKDLDLPTTPEDSVALRCARQSPAMTPAQYLEFLKQFAITTEQLRLRKGPRGVVPFTL